MQTAKYVRFPFRQRYKNEEALLQRKPGICKRHPPGGNIAASVISLQQKKF
jgi:hypothetical protein